MTPPLRIANASAFWGDQPDAAERLVAADPAIDWLTLDYLAEVSLSIMAIQRAKDPRAGYARDFLDVLRSLAPFWRAGGRVRIVTNAGGLDPLACGTAARALLDAEQLSAMRVAVIHGDDVLEQVRAATDAGLFANLETAEPVVRITERLVTANAYVGASEIAAAVKAGADVIITGRVADPSLTVGPCWGHFRWTANELDRLAGATIAGHLIECGTQVCGGFSTDWLSVPGNGDIGFPIAEISPDGTCVLTKPAGTGGSVTIQHTKEQLLYEIGDPARYLSPDVTVSLLGITLEQTGPDRVRVSGAHGSPPPPTLKVSATFADGYKAHGMLTIFGHRAQEKARRAGEALLGRLADRGTRFRETLVECLGTGVAAPRGAGDVPSDPIEAVLRVSVAADTKAPVERFTREIASLVTSGPQGTTGYATGRPRVLPIYGYWPCLIDRRLVQLQTTWMPHERTA